MTENCTKRLASLETDPPQPESNCPSFPLFQALPTELRLKIWTIVLSTPRTITIACEKPPFTRGRIRAAQGFKSNLPTPTLLHVCRESRAEALNIYKSHFKTSRSNDTYISARNSIYVSFAQDVLRFEDTMLPYLAETELQGIQNLILDIKDCAYFGHFNMGTVTRMRGLKTVDIWADQGLHTAWSRNFVQQLMGDFRDAREMDPGWECPKVNIFNRGTGAIVGNIDGGALIPGWVET
jgi:hypothetical protein